MTKLPTTKSKFSPSQRALLREIRSVREEIEDRMDYLLILESRVRDAGKRGATIEEVKARLGIK